MNKTKENIFRIMLLMLSLPFMAYVTSAVSLKCKAENPQQINSYRNPTPGQLPIMASGYYVNGHLTPEAVSLAKDCGFNIVSQLASSEQEVALSLQYAVENDIKVLVRSTSLVSYTKVEGFVNKFKDNPGVAGWMLTDEPQETQFESLGRLKAVIQSVDPDHLVYVNMLPVHSDYQAFLDKFKKEFDPPVWSYDLYPVYYLNGKYTQDKNMYRNLEMYSAEAKSTGNAFWAYVMCIQHNTGSTRVYPFPKIEEMRYSAFSALAYGAQGLVYWTYAMRKNAGNEVYITAPVDLEGRPTKVWTLVKQLNAEIRRYTDVFLGCEFQMARHTGSQIPVGGSRFDGPVGPLTSVSSGSDGVVVTHLTNNGTDYVVVVNHSARSSQRVNLRFDRPGVEITQKQNAKASTKYSGRLAGGGYRIFRFGN